jgi:rSAM/selenodomain-associated transferase 2
VIIPTLKPVADLGVLLSTLEGELWVGDEVIVVQAMDLPGTAVDIGGKRHPMKLVFSPRGRGRQLNSGAASSRGSLLLFLHSDSQLSEGFRESIRCVCSDHRVSLGCFRLAFRPTNRAMNWIAAWANLRTRALRMPYGDQGLFCRRETWERAGGFRREFLLEDVDFVRHCRKLGRIRMLEDPIFTSPRRYMEYGIWRASIQNHMTLLRYYIGVDDGALYREYYREILTGVKPAAGVHSVFADSPCSEL